MCDGGGGGGVGGGARLFFSVNRALMYVVLPINVDWSPRSAGDESRHVKSIDVCGVGIIGPESNQRSPAAQWLHIIPERTIAISEHVATSRGVSETHPFPMWGRRSATVWTRRAQTGACVCVHEWRSSVAGGRRVHCRESHARDRVFPVIRELLGDMHRDAMTNNKRATRIHMQYKLYSAARMPTPWARTASANVPSRQESGKVGEGRGRTGARD